MADRKITDLTALAAGSQATGDLLTIVDVSEGAAADKNKKITVESLFKGIPGDVGISTSSPRSTLHVAGNLTITKASNNPAIVFDEHSGSTDPKAQIQMDQTNSTNASLLFSTEGSGTLSERLRIDSSGNVGINTTSPAANLHVVNDSSAAARIGGTNYYLDLGAYASGSSPAISYNGSGASLPIRNGTSEVARFDSSGRLLVGTSSVSYTTTAVFEGNSGSATTQGQIYLNRGETSVTSGETLGIIRFGATGDLRGADIRGVADGTWATDDYPASLRFYTTADGASSPTERMRILAGGGLTFNGDTAAANALDDYEEGFFTPTLVGASGGAAASYTHQNGGYVKVGNVVHVYGYLKISSKGTSISGALKVGGFPFSVKNNPNYYHAPGIGWYTGFSGVTVYGLGFDIAPNATSFTLARGSGTGVNSVTLSQITDTFGVEWAFTYRTE